MEPKPTPKKRIKRQSTTKMPPASGKPKNEVKPEMAPCINQTEGLSPLSPPSTFEKTDNLNNYRVSDEQVVKKDTTTGEKSDSANVPPQTATDATTDLSKFDFIVVSIFFVGASWGIGLIIEKLLSFAYTEYHPQAWLSFLIGLAITFVATLAAVAAGNTDQDANGKSKFNWIALFYVAGLIATVVFTITKGLSLVGGFAPVVSAPSMRYAGAMTAVSASILLFTVRLKFRLLYGITEVGVAYYIAWSKIPSVDFKTFMEHPLKYEDPKTLAIYLLTGSIYLGVRGWDNIYEGWRKKSTRYEIYRSHDGLKKYLIKKKRKII
jgi:hypothetical protein